jgi:putative transposase
MKSLHGEYRIRDLCAAFRVSRSGYYRWRTAEQSARAKEDALIGAQLRTLHTQSRGTYGRPRLCAALRQLGRNHSSKRIGRLMRILGLKEIQRGRFRAQTTVSNHELKRAPNRLLQAPPTQQKDQVWVADITFVPTGEGWLYVAGVLYRHSRRVLGLGFGARLDCGLAERALHQALVRRGGKTQIGLLHHSERTAICQRQLSTLACQRRHH